MNRSPVGLACGVAGLAIGLMLAAAPTGHADVKTSDVRVVNSTLEPVPVSPQGVTQVNGTVTLGEIPWVNVTPGSHIFTRPAIPDVYQRFSEVSNLGHISLAIPEDQIWVVEHVSTRLRLNPETTPIYALLETRLGDNPDSSQFWHYLNLRPSTCQSGFVCYSSHEAIRMYAKEELHLFVPVDGPGEPSISLHASGHLLDLTSRVP